MINSAHENYSSHLITHWKVLLRPVSLLCGLAQPTPADTFLLREKYPKAYLRGFPLDIPWGLRPRSNRKAVTLPLIHHRSLVLHQGIEGGSAPFCRKSKNQEVFGVSLVTFFTQESYRGVERVAPQRKAFDDKHPVKLDLLTVYGIIIRKKVYVVCPTSELLWKTACINYSPLP